jgi:hypothetical protein
MRAKTSFQALFFVVRPTGSNSNRAVARINTPSI